MQKFSFKEKYLIILVMLCFVVIGLYYSYAIFVTKQLQENVVVINTDYDSVSLKINNQDNKYLIKKNTKEDIEIEIENTINRDIYYLVLVKGIKTGVKISSDDVLTGLLEKETNKRIMVHLNNTTESDVTLEFICQTSINETMDKEIGYSYINKQESFDHSGANKPEINNLKLIPVAYNITNEKEGYWYKTDINNQDELWYDYDNGIWANAVLVNNDNFNKYHNMEIGSEIEIGDILGFYVWIPRFKYYIVNNSSYTNYERINNIIFENGDAITGTVSCMDKISSNIDSHVYSEICMDNKYNHIYDNLSTYTHPSFDNKKGFWVAKFLTGDSNKSLPNAIALKRNINDIMSLMDNSKHLITNMEYASIILLSNSYYGKSGNSDYVKGDNYTFQRIYANTNIYDLTGCSSEYNSYSKNFLTTESKTCVEYNNLTDYSHISNSVDYPVGKIGPGASSTGTIYGVYDLANLKGELVAGFVANQEGDIQITSNYYDTYSYNNYLGKVTSSKSINNLYRYKLGDAIRENFRSFTINGMWHSGLLEQKENMGVLLRGGNGISDNASVYTTSIVNYGYEAPYRIVLN